MSNEIRPGDLCRVTRNADCFTPIIDKIVTVTTPCEAFGVPCWWLVEKVEAMITKPGVTPNGMRVRAGDMVFIESLPAVMLQPIRDQPGEDETLIYAGRPRELSLP